MKVYISLYVPEDIDIHTCILGTIIILIATLKYFKLVLFTGKINPLQTEPF